MGLWQKLFLNEGGVARLSSFYFQQTIPPCLASRYFRSVLPIVKIHKSFPAISMRSSATKYNTPHRLDNTISRNWAFLRSALHVQAAGVTTFVQDKNSWQWSACMIFILLPSSSYLRLQLAPFIAVRLHVADVAGPKTFPPHYPPVWTRILVTSFLWIGWGQKPIKQFFVFQRQSNGQGRTKLSRLKTLIFFFLLSCFEW